VLSNPKRKLVRLSERHASLARQQKSAKDSLHRWKQSRFATGTSLLLAFSTGALYSLEGDDDGAGTVGASRLRRFVNAILMVWRLTATSGVQASTPPMGE